MPSELPPPNSQVDDLRELIADGQVVAIVGAGVTMSTTGLGPAMSWKGLLERGIEHSHQFAGQSLNWMKWQRQALDEGDLVDMLMVAEQVSIRLGAPNGGEYVRWLRESVGPESLPIVDDSVIQALADLQVPLLTTNYDELIENVTGLPGVTWKDQHRLTRIVRGDEQAVLHLHGHWNVPDSVILGIRDYDEIKDDPHTQAVMQCLGYAKSLLFVGCGEGLNDPNFGNFLQWIGRVRASDPYRNYRLALQEEVDGLRNQHPDEQRIHVLSYGESHGDLAGFLRGLVPSATITKTRLGTPLGEVLDGYIEYLCREHAALPLIGISTGLKIDLPISKAYIPLRTCCAPRVGRGRFDVDDFQRGEDIQRDVDLDEMFNAAAKDDYRGVLLLGDPGAGKTTAARQLCWQLASGQTAASELGLPERTLPVFVRLRNLKPDDVKEGLQALVRSETRFREDDEVDAADELLEHPGNLLWIFDGLDEVVDESARVGVADWLAKLLNDRPNDRVLVTGRYQGVEGKVELGDGFARFEVQPLDDDQAGDFIHTWFNVAYQRLGLDNQQAKAKSHALLGLLHQPDYRIGRMAELRSNPLMLTVLCLVYHEDDSLPRSRARLYERCVRVLLETWRQQVHVQHGGRPYNPEAARQVLASVAWWMHEQVDRRSVPLDAMEQQASEALGEFPNSGLGQDGQEFIRLMREDSGILAASGAGQAEFLHLTFQEYLAALHAVQHEQATHLADQLEESWWQEVILLALAQGTPSFSRSFFEASLKRKDFERQSSFIERCLQESEPLSRAPFVRCLQSSKVSQRRKISVLHHLRTYAFPELVEICRPWLNSSNSELASLSREILNRAGEESNTTELASEWIDPKTDIAFVRIAAGSFDMGDTSDGPIHRVTISQDFGLGKYPVTNAEYAEFLAATDHEEPEYWKDRRFNQERQPVVGVSWEDAQAFCKWSGFRLPTEAQWEYACRAGTTTAYSFGDDGSDLKSHMWYSDNSDSQTQAVGGKPPNPWGLHDMHGNVLESCEDWYGDYPSEDVVDPVCTDKAVYRVIRGGSWGSVAGYCRSAYRDWDVPTNRFSDVGFRVAAVPPTTQAQPST